jgi:hypothetical protein
MKGSVLLLPVCAVALGALVAVGAGGGAAQAARRVAPAGHSFTLYAVPKLRGFVNNEDDRARGLGNNPFGNYGGAAASSQVTNDRLLGPFPGDEGIFTYTVYSNAAHTDRIGTALLICQYGFNRNAWCDASYQLKDGLLIGAGTTNAHSTSFALRITGGTDGYSAMKGIVHASLKGLPYSPAYLALEPQRLAFAIKPASSTATPNKNTLYSLVTEEQFIDNGDDEARGYAENPFEIHDSGLQASEDEDKNGPYPGDEAVFLFNVYSDHSLKKKVGWATYTCQYSFNRNAFCDAAYELDGGTMTGAGSFSFNAPTFEMAITGGTGSYASSSGELEATPSGKSAQRLVLSVVKP